MRLIKKLLFAFTILAAVLWSNWASAQISEGGTPPSFSLKGITQIQKKAPFTASVGFDVAALKAEDAKDVALGAPLRAAKVIPTDLTMANSGEWINLPNGQTIWRLTIRAPKALATALYYDDFFIPEGGKLFIYNKSKTQVFGAYTSKTNPKGKEFATELVAGDELTLEYVLPAPLAKDVLTNTDNKLSAPLSDVSSTPESSSAPINNKARIKISGIAYGYNHIAYYNNDGIRLENYDESLPCQVNINCPEGANWQHHKRGVVRALFTDGNQSWWCSGTIVNNTNEDLTPYYLTAHHCISDATTSSLNKTVFTFNYEFQGCGHDGKEPKGNTMVGAALMASTHGNGGADGALIRLNEAIPDYYNVYYNGWDRSGVTPTSGVGIHHPSGDVKKISTYIVAPENTTWKITGQTGATDAHWNVKRWEITQSGYSFTEGGSSGSPLFNQNGLVVGTLTGGPTIKYCDRQVNYSIYGKLWYHWDQDNGTTASPKMQPFLDPANTGVTTLKGRYATGDYYANFEIYKDGKTLGNVHEATIYAGESLMFIDRSLNASSWDWEFPGGSTTTAAGKDPKTITYSVAGNYDVKLIINKGTANEKERRILLKVVKKQNMCPTEVEIGTGNTLKSQFPLGQLNQLVASSSIYTKEEIGGAGTITNLSWNAANATNKPREFFILMTEVDESTHTNPAVLLDYIGTGDIVYIAPTPNNYYHWTNDAGWVNIKLDTPFEYSGEKNLRITTFTRVSTTTISTDCYYTEKPNTHMEWTNDAIEFPTGVGTINNNRPNIKITVPRECGNDPLKADFTANASDLIILKQGFDEHLSAEWNVVGNWIYANYSASPFNVIDPLSKFSIITLGSSANVNAKVISPEIEIPADAKLEFYTIYTGGKLNLARGSFHISTDGGTTWTEKWTAGSIANPNLGLKWRKFEMDMSTYAGQKVKLAWHYDGVNGDHFAVDGLKVNATPTEKRIKVFEGDYVQFTDLSQGPPVSWEWTFDGVTNIATSKEQNPKVQYLSQGAQIETIVPVTLKVSDESNSDTKTVTDAVTVVKRTPEADFSVVGGDYVLHDNWGSMLPRAGGTVRFDDLTKNYPTAWSWKANGTEISTQKSFTHNFTEIGTYKIELGATNAAGTGTVEKDAFVVVGDKANIWNIPYGDGGKGMPIFTWDLIPGYGIYIDVEATNWESTIAERFDAPSSPGAITEVKIAFRKGTNDNGGQPLSIYLFEELGGEPDLSNILAFKKINASDVQATGYTTITFDNPAYVSGAYYVVIGDIYFSSSAGVGYAIYTSEKIGNGTAYQFDGSQWYSLGNIPNDFKGLLKNLDLSLNVVSTFEYTYFDLDKTSISKQTIDKTADVVKITSSADEYTAIPSAAWIDVTKSGKRFTVSCSENKYKARVGYITVSGVGFTKYVFVEQAGAAPTDLYAKVVGDSESNVELTWSDLSKEQPVGDDVVIFDDFENHNMFTINSAGPFNLSYIDGDNEPTLSFSGMNFSNQGSKMAFIVYNPKGSTPAGNPSFDARSGSQYLASFPSTSGSNDDWVISPILEYTKNFTFAFWAKSYNSTLTSINVYASVSGKDKTDFILLEKINFTDQSWKQYEYSLPKIVKYVAISCTHSKTGVTLIDDFFVGIGNAPQSSKVKDNKEVLQGTMNFEQLTVKTDVVKQSSKLSSALESGLAVPAALESNTTQSNDASSLVALHWDDGIARDGVGLTNGGTFEVAIKFNITDLIDYHKSQLVSVKMYPYSSVADGTSYTLKIRQGGNVVLSQQLPNIVTGNYNTIKLHTPITIDATQELLVGYEVTHKAGVYAAALDNLAGISGKGNLISLDGGKSFRPLDELGVKGNWNIVALINPMTVKQVFQIYSSDTKIGTTEEFTYLDVPSTAGNICYQVTSIQDNLESAKSNTACVNIKVPLTIKANDIEREFNQPNPTDVSAMYTITGFVDGDTESMLSTKPVVTLDDNMYGVDKAAGVYTNALLVSGAADATNKYRFVYENGTLTINKSTTFELLLEVLVNGTTHDINEVYNLDCASSVFVEIKTQPGTVISTGSSFVVSNLKIGINEIPFTMVSENTATPQTYILKVSKGFTFSDYVVQKQNHLLVVDLNKLANEGYVITGYKWYKNNQLVGTASHFTEGDNVSDVLDKTAEYRVELTTTNGNVLMSCPGTITLKSIGMIAYPNPVNSGGIVTIKTNLNSDDLDGAMIEIYDIMGKRIGTTPAGNSSESQVVLPTVSGMYIIKLKGKYGLNEEFKVIVK